MTMPVEGGGMRFRQWRTQPLVEHTIAAAIGFAYETVLQASDCRLLYVMVDHSSVGAENVRVRVTMDGTAFVETWNMATGTVYYYYRDDDADALAHDANRTLAGLGVPWVGQSAHVEIAGQAIGGVTDLHGAVRYEQL